MSHSKDLGSLLTEQEQEATLVSLLSAWGPVEVPALRAAPVPALVDLATRAVTTLAEDEALSVDQSAELHGRIQALRVLAAVSASVPVSDASASSLFDALASTLPDPSLATSWNVLATAVAGVAAVLGETLLPGAGGAVGAGQAVAGWPGWLGPQQTLEHTPSRPGAS
jgi:hypothetical protein